MANLGRIRDDHGRLADNVIFDQPTTMRVVENGSLDGLPFTVLVVGARISRSWFEGEVQVQYFHVVSWSLA